MSALAKQEIESEMADEIRNFFDAFCIAFLEFNGAVIAKHYAIPYTALSADRKLQVFDSQEKISQYFQGFLDQYHDQGCRTCQYKELEVVFMGQESAVASLTWLLLNQDHDIVTTWRESYTLTRISDELRIYGSTDHA